MAKKRATLNRSEINAYKQRRMLVSNMQVAKLIKKDTSMFNRDRTSLKQAMIMNARRHSREP